ncbi:MAG: hypothetical protein WKF90_02340 [Pyrinomonadaceae bacterium]
MENPENIFIETSALLKSRNEWLLIGQSGKTFALERDEIELTFERGRIILGFLGEKGFQIWRVANCRVKDEKIIFDITRNFEKERKKIQLVPRILARALGDAVELARLEKANQIARLIVSETQNSKLIRVALNEENGRFAHIIFETASGEQMAALADVAEQATPELFLTTAILWLAQLERRKKKPVSKMWILTEKKQTKNLQKLHALLRENYQRQIKLWEIFRKGTKARTDEENSLKEVASLKIKDLWRAKKSKFLLETSFEVSRTAREIISLAPEKTDFLFTKNGESLRFRGLPFARVRKVLNEEKVWFGIEKNKQILNETSRREFFELLENLEIYRQFNSPNKRHALFRLAPEAWLEAILRRNIKLLDRNLILSPVYNQFRASADRIDLLALRRDGRLVIIELKVSPDREMIFQAIDYWRKIELHRRQGNLQTAKIFGDMEIVDEPSIVYLAAPTLSFHRDFDFLAKTVTPEIEIYRFDLNENWRESLKVLCIEKIQNRFQPKIDVF